MAFVTIITQSTKFQCAVGWQSQFNDECGISVRVTETLVTAIDADADFFGVRFEFADPSEIEDGSRLALRTTEFDPSARLVVR